MAIAILSAIVVSVVGCLVTSIQVNPTSQALVFMVALGAFCPIPLYCNEKKQSAYRETSLALAWMAAVYLVVRYPIMIAAKLRLPLQDAHLALFDRAFGVDVSAIVHWTAQHRAAQIVNATYEHLLPFMLAAVFLPVLAGRVTTAREFLVANMISFAVAIPLFALVPSVGSWFSGGFRAFLPQAQTQDELMAIRKSGVYILTTQGAGIIGFPSFHVIWAVLSARALWGFRWLRIPVAILATMIVLSTMTSGWHYFADVLAGLAVAGGSIFLARKLLRGTEAMSAT